MAASEKEIPLATVAFTEISFNASISACEKGAQWEWAIQALSKTSFRV